MVDLFEQVVQDHDQEDKDDESDEAGQNADPVGQLGRPAAGEAELEAICRSSDISKRERDLLVLILAGKSNRDIGRELFISYHTVKNHVYNIFQKLGV